MAATIDAYIADFPPDVQDILQRVRTAITAAIPGATEAISYGIPTYLSDGRRLLYFAGWKRHVSIYPVPPTDAALGREIAPYRAEKSTLKFPLAKPIPYDLIGRVAAAASRGREDR